MEWYNFTPNDTIFFRGAEPMVMGESHSSSFNFPPPHKTIIGALRTAILKENNIFINDYYDNKVDDKILDIVGKADEDANFGLIGPFFDKEGIIYVPAPYSWFFEKDDDNPENRTVNVLKSQQVDVDFIKSDKKGLYWVKNAKNEVETLGGKWIKLTDLNNNKTQISYIKNKDLFIGENRTGIALESKSRIVRKSHIYQFNHIRFKKGVTMIFGVNKELPIPDRGALKLGAEQRFGSYEKIKIDNIEFNNADQYMSLSLVEGTEKTNNSLIATGKPVYLGGWNMKKGFHRPMRGYYPAGTIFNTKINENVIAI